MSELCRDLKELIAKTKSAFSVSKEGLLIEDKQSARRVVDLLVYNLCLEDSEILDIYLSEEVILIIY